MFVLAAQPLILCSVWLLPAHLSAVLHVLLQTFNCLPAHTFTLWTTDSAFGHNLDLPALLLTSWKSKTEKVAFDNVGVVWNLCVFHLSTCRVGRRILFDGDAGGFLLIAPMQCGPFTNTGSMQT